MLYSNFKSTDEAEKPFWFTVLPLIDISHFRDTETVGILSGAVGSKFVVSLKTSDTTRVERSNTNNTNILKHQLLLINSSRQKMTKLTAK